MPSPLQELFQYDDYRRFLSDYFQEQKRTRAVFSHRFFARKAGFTSSSFCLSVIKGRFNLSQAAMEKIVKAMDLDSRQSSYFCALVRYNQAKEQPARDEAWATMIELRRSMEFVRLERGQHDYFSRWYYPVLRELACHPSWDGDYQKLARRLEPGLSTDEARKGVEDLVQWGILVSQQDGSFRPAAQLVNAEGVPPMALRQIRREMLQNGIGALDSMPSSQRYTAISAMAMSESTFQYAIQVLEEARRKILAQVAMDSQVDKVYAMTLQVFPVTKPLGENAQ